MNLKLNSDRVPASLRSLIPLAEEFGLEDDVQRIACLGVLDTEMARKLLQMVQENERAMDEWLAGPEGLEDEVSDEYVAFTYLRIAAEEAAGRNRF